MTPDVLHIQVTNDRIHFYVKNNVDIAANSLSLSSADVPGITLGRSWPLCPAADMHEQICQLVWHHAPGPFADETGSHSVQGPGIDTAQKVQRHRETLTKLRNPFPLYGDGKRHPKTPQNPEKNRSTGIKTGAGKPSGRERIEIGGSVVLQEDPSVRDRH